jgi:hypothetical protein
MFGLNELAQMKKSGKEFVLHQVGGVTRAEITLPDGTTLTGETVSKRDSFCRRHGVKVAIGRAMRGLK